MLRIGLISDTHGLLRPEAVDFLRGADHLVHAGDIGGPGIVEALAGVAPVTVVRGNNDLSDWEHLAETALLRFEGVAVYALHDVSELRRRPPPAGVRVVISGHSHKPAVSERDGILYVNPGSAGPCRFRLPVSVGELIVEGESVSARWIELTLEPAPR